MAKKVNKITIAEMAKMPNAISIGNKYRWAINNNNIDVVKDRGLTSVKNTRAALAKLKSK